MNRENQIKKLKENNWSWQAIGNYFGISRARAWQIGSGYSPWLIDYKQVKKRDYNTCQLKLKCNGSNKNLIIHHIDFNDLNNSLDNLITCCRSCHKYFHSKFHVDIEKEEKLQKGHNVITNLIKDKCCFCGKVEENTKSIYKTKKKQRGFFCSTKCYKLYLEKIKTRKCKICGQKYLIKNYVKASSFCSRKCLGQFIGKNYGFKPLKH